MSELKNICSRRCNTLLLFFLGILMLIACIFMEQEQWLLISIEQQSIQIIKAISNDHNCPNTYIHIIPNSQFRKRINPIDFDTNNASTQRFNHWVESNTLFRFYDIHNDTQQILFQDQRLKYCTYDHQVSFIQCLMDKGIKTILFLGDSQIRTIVDAIGHRLLSRNILNEETIRTNPHGNYLHFETVNGILFHFVWMDHIHIDEVVEFRNDQSLINIMNVLYTQYEPDVILFGVGLWTLKRASDPMYYYQKYLPHFMEFVHEAFEVKYGTQIIWKTMHYEPNEKYVQNGLIGKQKDLYRLKMNVVSNSMAHEYNWLILDDYTMSHQNQRQIVDTIHYPINSTIMNHTLSLLKYFICNVNTNHNA